MPTKTTTPRHAEIRSAPPADSVAPPDDALSRLEDIARRPMDEAARAAAALRETLEPYRQRAARCLTQLNAQQATVEARLQRVDRLPLMQWELTLGGSSSLIPQLRAVVARVAIVFQSRVDAGGSVPSLTQALRAVPNRIDQLTAADRHACPMPPPPCGCAPATIRDAVENAERMADRLPDDLAALDDVLTRITHALAARGEGVMVTRGAAPPAGAGLGIEEGAGT